MGFLTVMTHRDDTQARSQYDPATLRTGLHAHQPENRIGIAVDATQGIGSNGPSQHRQTRRPGLLDYVVTAPLVAAGTVNLWKVQSLRQLSPIDLTALSAIILAVVVTLSLLAQPRFSSLAAPLLALATLFLPGLLQASLSHSYSVEKSILLYTLIPLILAGGIQLLSTERRRRALVHCIATAGLTVSLFIELVGTPTTSSPDRVGIQDGNVIGLALVCSLGALSLALMPGNRRGRMLRWLGALACLHAAASTGSRGPIVASLLALLVASIAASRSDAPGRVKWLAVPVALTAAVTLVAGPNSRLTTAFGGESDVVRVDLIRASWALFMRNPLGIGWGDFVLDMPLTLRDETQAWRQYPHNIFFEGAAEGGLLAIAFLIAVCLFAVKPLWHIARDGNPVYLGLLLSSLIAASSSSDLIGNRTAWLFLGLGLGARAAWVRRPQDEQE